MCQELNETDFNDAYACTNPEEAYNIFHNKLMKAYNTCLPLVNVKDTYVNMKKPWITKGILKSRKTKTSFIENF